jgi:hypothetical protein
MVLEVVKGFPVEGVCAGIRCDQYLAGRGYITRDVLGRTVELEFADGALRDIEDRRSDSLICNVLTVKKDPCRTPGDTSCGDGGIPCLGRVERFAALQDHARFDLGKVEEVAAVDRQRLDLVAGDDVADTGLIGIDLERAGRHFYGLGCRTDRELEVPAGGGTGANDGGDRQLLKPWGVHGYGVRPRIQRAEAIKST